MKFDIISRWTGEVRFTAEIDCADDAPRSIKTGLAVKWAIKNGANLSSANLRYANLRYANLRYANLRSADLRSADLSSANLSSANLSSADLRSANLSSANLRSADLSSANLSSADLRSADLRYANLRSADLSSANLSSADLRSANLRYANLRSANLLCFGNMAEIRTMQIGRWRIGYTATELQIGCQRHAIEKWAKWDTAAGCKWVSSMDKAAPEWADRNMALVLALIEANPANEGTAP
jgi:hypothetical protein